MRSRIRIRLDPHLDPDPCQNETDPKPCFDELVVKAVEEGRIKKEKLNGHLWSKLNRLKQDKKIHHEVSLSNLVDR